MTHHSNLEKGLSILEARLGNSRHPYPDDYFNECRPFITISRETSAGATTLGHLLLPLLERRLGEPGREWILLDKDLLNRVLATQHLPQRLAAFLPEDKISEIKAVIGELVGLHPPLWQLEQQVAEAIRQFAEIGRAIFVGRGAQLVTRSLPGGFHVRLVASLQARVERTAALLKCDRATAEAHVLRNDSARDRYVKMHFAEDIGDPHLYDIVINTDQIPTAAAAPLVAQLLAEKMARVAPRPASTPPLGMKDAAD